MTNPTRTLTISGTNTHQRVLDSDYWFGVTYEYLRFNGGHQMNLLPCVDQPDIIPMMGALDVEDAKEVDGFPADVTRIEVTANTGVVVTAFSLNEDNPDLKLDPIEVQCTTCALLPGAIQLDGVEVFTFDVDLGYWKHNPTGDFYSDLNFTAHMPDDQAEPSDGVLPEEQTREERLKASLRTALGYLNAIPNTKPKGFEKSTYEVIPSLQSALQ